MGTLLTCRPLGGGISPNILRGELNTPIVHVVDVPYDGSWPPDPAKGLAAIVMLHDYIMSSEPPVTVVGHSMGGEVIYGCLRNYTDMPASTRFVSLGNPERKYNSVCVLRPTDFPAIYGGLGVPDGVGYELIDMARQYDFYADHPNTYTDPTASLNALLGMGIHGDYNNVGLNDAGNTYRVEGNITYILSPTFPCPIVNLNWLAWIPWIRDSEDAAKRAIIEACFSRPGALSTIPDPAPERTSSTVTTPTTSISPPVSSSVGSFPVTTTKSTQQINRPTVNPFRIGMWPWQSP